MKDVYLTCEADTERRDSLISVKEYNIPPPRSLGEIISVGVAESCTKAGSINLQYVPSTRDTDTERGEN